MLYTWDRRGNFRNLIMAFVYQIVSYIILSVGILADERSILLILFASVLYIFGGTGRMRLPS
jgi:hypothetical protein